MKLDWAIDTFKGLIVAGITWTVIYLRKKAKPTLKSFLKFTKVVEKTDDQGTRVSSLEAIQTAMWDISRDPFFRTNDKGEVVYANNAFAKMCGLSDPRDCYGMGYMALIPEDDEKKIERQVKQFIEHPGPFEGMVRYVNQQTKQIVITDCRTAPWYLDGKFMGNVGRPFILRIEEP